MVSEARNNGSSDEESVRLKAGNREADECRGKVCYPVIYISLVS